MDKKLTEQQLAAAEFLFSDEYKNLLLRAISARLATTQNHADLHKRAYALVAAFAPPPP